MRSKSVLPSELVSAGRRIDRWRARNGGRRLIPESVWVEATDLARAHGVRPVSKVMRLKHEKLRERVEALEPNRPKSKSRRTKQSRTKARSSKVAKPRSSKGASSGVANANPSFVDIGTLGLAYSGVMIEITDGSGRCLTIRGATEKEVLGIVAAFYGGRAA